MNMADSGVETGNDSDSTPACTGTVTGTITVTSTSSNIITSSITAPYWSSSLSLSSSYYKNNGNSNKNKGLKCKSDRGCPYSSFLQRSKDSRLRMASGTNNITGVAKVLSEGANPSSADNHGRTPLHLASCRGYREIVRLLLAAGADPNKKDSMGSTPLHLAACTNHVPLIIELLDGGADVAQADWMGRNPLHLAQSKLRLFRMKTMSGPMQLAETVKIRDEVTVIVDMMRRVMAMKKKDVCEIEDIRRRLENVSTGEQMDDEVQKLLKSLDTLKLSS